MISILSRSGYRKATLIPTEEGADVRYYRGFQSSCAGGIQWNLDHVAEMRGLPFHRCLDVATGIVEQGVYRIRRA
jgi:hypothetical protein